MFWTRWIKEYLPTLLIRRCWNLEVKPLTVSALASIVDGSTPRNTWIKGSWIKGYMDLITWITTFYPEKDDRARKMVNVRTSTCHVLKRFAVKTAVKEPVVSIKSLAVKKRFNYINCRLIIFHSCRLVA